MWTGERGALERTRMGACVGGMLRGRHAWMVACFTGHEERNRLGGGDDEVSLVCVC